VRNLVIGIESAHLVKHRKVRACSLAVRFALLARRLALRTEPYPVKCCTGRGPECPIFTKVRVVQDDIVGVDRDGGLWIIGENRKVQF
jgi:hypothetical protein